MLEVWRASRRIEGCGAGNSGSRMVRAVNSALESALGAVNSGSGAVNGGLAGAFGAVNSGSGAVNGGLAGGFGAVMNSPRART